MRRYFYRYNIGKEIVNDPHFKRGNVEGRKEVDKRPYRFDVINALLNSFKRSTSYLEIGVRNPSDNFNRIKADQKYSVDPGLEFEQNPVDFQVTSDAFFNQLRNGKILSKDVKFEVIFIDGLHLAEQVDRDIANALDFITDDGFIVLHDCNPPTEWHARETFEFINSPAGRPWNGTTWKAFVKAKDQAELHACCVDTDFGVGILSKKVFLGTQKKVSNPFFEFHTFEQHRTDSLNLVSFDNFKSYIE